MTFLQLLSVFLICLSYTRANEILDGQAKKYLRATSLSEPLIIDLEESPRSLVEVELHLGTLPEYLREINATNVTVTITLEELVENEGSREWVNVTEPWGPIVLGVKPFEELKAFNVYNTDAYDRDTPLRLLVETNTDYPIGVEIALLQLRVALMYQVGKRPLLVLFLLLVPSLCSSCSSSSFSSSA